MGALNSIRDAATNPLALIAFLATVIAWAWVWHRTKRLGLLLHRMEDLPKSKRLEVIKQEMGVVLPDRISSEQWIRSRKHQYLFVGYLALCFLALCIVAIAFWSGDDGRSEEKMNNMQKGMEDTKADIGDIRNKSDQQFRQLANLDEQIRAITGKLGGLSLAHLEIKTFDKQQSRELLELTDKVDQITQDLRDQTEVSRFSEHDRQRLLRAEAGVFQNKALLDVHDGRLDQAFEQLSKAIGIYQDNNETFAEDLGRTLNDRSFVLYTQGKPEEASKDVAAAKVIFTRLVQDEGGVELVAELDNLEQSRQIIETGMTPGVHIANSPICSIKVSPLTRTDMPAISRVLVFKSGENQSTQFTDQLGTPMLVPPGTYDIRCESDGQSQFLLVSNVQVAEKQQAQIDTDREIAMLEISPLTYEGLEIEQVMSGNAVSDLTSFRGRYCEFGKPFFVTGRTRHDLVVKQAGGQSVRVATNVTALPGRRTVVDPHNETAVISVPDPGLEGFRLETIFVLKPETSITGSFYPVQQAAGYDRPMLVRADEPYDVFLRPEMGQLTRFAENVVASPNQHMIVRKIDERQQP